jgi:hypothetical protein
MVCNNKCATLEFLFEDAIFLLASSNNFDFRETNLAKSKPLNFLLQRHYPRRCPEFHPAIRSVQKRRHSFPVKDKELERYSVQSGGDLVFITNFVLRSLVSQGGPETLRSPHFPEPDEPDRPSHRDPSGLYSPAKFETYWKVI